jgi:hypothetical protein
VHDAFPARPLVSQKEKEKKISCIEQSNVRIYARWCLVLVVQGEVTITVLHGQTAAHGGALSIRMHGYRVLSAATKMNLTEFGFRF